MNNTRGQEPVLPPVEGRIDRESRGYVVTVEVNASPEAVWTLWSDRRRLERRSGRPAWPLTITEFDFTPGGVARYRVSNPDCLTVHGRWLYVTVDPPSRLEWIDLFVGLRPGDATPAPAVPAAAAESAELAGSLAGEGVRELITIEPAGSTRSRVTRTSTFASLDRLDQMIAAGAPEAVHRSMSDLDAALLDG